MRPPQSEFELHGNELGQKSLTPHVHAASCVCVVGARFGPDLSFLLGLVAAGELDPQIGWRGPWGKVGVAAEALLGRQVRGKAVLDVSS